MKFIDSDVGILPSVRLYIGLEKLEKLYSIGLWAVLVHPSKPTRTEPASHWHRNSRNGGLRFNIQQ